MFQYLQSNDAAIEYLKSKDVITSRVNDNCEELIARSSGSAGYKPAPRRCKGTLVERKFHNKDGQGDPAQHATPILISWKKVYYRNVGNISITFYLR